MSKHAKHAGTYVPCIVEDGNVHSLVSCKTLQEAIYALHDEVGTTHFGEKTDYDDGSYVREMLAGPKGPDADTTLVGIVRFFPDEGKAEELRKAELKRAGLATLARTSRAKSKTSHAKSARKSGRKAAESGKPTATVHFTAAQKRILLEGLKRFVNSLR